MIATTSPALAEEDTNTVFAPPETLHKFAIPADDLATIIKDFAGNSDVILVDQGIIDKEYGENILGILKYFQDTTDQDRAYFEKNSDHWISLFERIQYTYRISHEGAFARHTNLGCVIVLPKFDQTAEVISTLSGIPKDLIEYAPGHLEDWQTGIILHEARHCGQVPLTPEMNHDHIRLYREIEADQALLSFLEISGAQYKISYLSDAWKQVRVMSEVHGHSAPSHHVGWHIINTDTPGSQNSETNNENRGLVKPEESVVLSKLREAMQQATTNLKSTENDGDRLFWQNYVDGMKTFIPSLDR